MPASSARSPQKMLAHSSAKQSCATRKSFASRDHSLVFRFIALGFCFRMQTCMCQAQRRAADANDFSQHVRTLATLASCERHSSDALLEFTMPKKASRTSRFGSKSHSGKRWVAGVKTVSTFPPEGLFTKDAATIARSLASKKVSPKGPVSGMRMLTYFINRGGRGLSPSRRAELERAKKLLSKRIQNAKEKTPRAA